MLGINTYTNTRVFKSSVVVERFPAKKFRQLSVDNFVGLVVSSTVVEASIVPDSVATDAFVVEVDNVSG